MTVKLVYETHSTTVDNETGIATGWLPGELSAEGRRESVLLGERRQDVDAIFSSDLLRAVKTVEIAFEGQAIPRFQDWRLRECDYGELNGAPVEQLAPRRPKVGVPFPGGQSYRDVLGLTQSFLADIKGPYDGRKVLVVGHGAQRWALQHLLGDGTPLEDLVDAPFAWQPGWEYEL
ncbi:histidine phosphatase family protein [Kribbella sp. VKM Ac-2568]|uniref:histidine phosphatase family protein n=1 Tax=Kribbella sp. VKM Ac-2568 TaxID=2512219 RepID=UPI0010471B22|nr:histidine phosphatase family protein [Kribbella sp. VKM Ac-2568]TCM46065.1 alpha-ribazole phosphatase/probable phosphoglycerate mutase [Kribbella sp. VKM Ac-2568]